MFGHEEMCKNSALSLNFDSLIKKKSPTFSLDFDFFVDICKNDNIFFRFFIFIN